MLRLCVVAAAFGATAAIPSTPLDPSGTRIRLSPGGMSIYSYTITENNDVTIDLVTSPWGDCQLTVGLTQPTCDPSLSSTINISSDACSFYYDRSDQSGCCENWVTIANNDPLFQVGETLWVEVVNGYATAPSTCSLQVTYGSSSLAADERARAEYLGWAIGVPVALILLCVVIPVFAVTRCCTVCCWQYRYVGRASQAAAAPPTMAVVVLQPSTSYPSGPGSAACRQNAGPPALVLQDPWPTAPGTHTVLQGADGTRYPEAVATQAVPL